MTSTAPTDPFGTRIEPGDHVVPLGDPNARPLLVVHATDDGHLTVHRNGHDHPARARAVRVVTIRDNAGERLGAGDVVRVPGGDDPDRTYVVDELLPVAHLVTVFAGDPVRPVPMLPALLVRVGCAPHAGDQVVDEHGVLSVVLGYLPDGRVSVEAVHGGDRVDVHPAGLRRVVDGHPGVVVGEDGSFRVPAVYGGDVVDLDALRDVQAFLGDLPRAIRHLVVVPEQRAG